MSQSQFFVLNVTPLQLVRIKRNLLKAIMGSFMDPRRERPWGLGNMGREESGFYAFPSDFGVCIQFSSVQSLSGVWLFVTPWIAAHQAQHTRPPCPSPTPRVHPDSRHWVSDAIQPSHPLSSPSPPAPNPSQHQSLFQGVCVITLIIALFSLFSLSSFLTNFLSHSIPNGFHLKTLQC